MNTPTYTGWACHRLTNLVLMFNQTKDHTAYAGFCVGLGERTPPHTFLRATGEASIQAFFERREQLLAEGLGQGSEREHSHGCQGCPAYKHQTWSLSEQIMAVNLSQYPSPCQSFCSYCDLRGRGLFAMTPTAHKQTTQCLDALDYALSQDLISPQAVWQLSCGEITIHPYRQRIYELIGTRTGYFFTNAFVFDSHIANNLVTNCHSRLNVSIDSGTAHSWHRVKGVDNFDTVLANLHRYRQHAIAHGQLVLKYILLLGQNTTPQDYAGVAELMLALGVQTLIIARNQYEKPCDAPAVVAQARQLIQVLAQHGLGYQLEFRFSKSERATITA